MSEKVADFQRVSSKAPRVMDRKDFERVPQDPPGLNRDDRSLLMESFS